MIAESGTGGVSNRRQRNRPRDGRHILQTRDTGQARDTGRTGQT